MALVKLCHMAVAAPIFYVEVTERFLLVVLIVMLAIEVAAFINCLTQRADAFPVVGSLSKVAWLAILGGSVLVTLVCFRFFLFSIFAFAAVTAALLYLLDVRPALRDAANGSGNW